MHELARKRLLVASAAETDLTQSSRVSSTDPANRLIDDEQRERLHRMLDRLPKKQRELVRMFHLQGRSYADISDQLQIPIGSVGPTLRRAEAKLREWLEAD